MDILVNFINPTLSLNHDEYEEGDDQESEGIESFSGWMILSPLNFIKVVGDMIPFKLRWAEASCI